MTICHPPSVSRPHSMPLSLRVWLLGVWLLIGLTTASLVRVQALVTYYVNARSGNDNRDGRSLATAWRTIAKANAWVQPGDTVVIYGGRYRERIAPTRSGTAQMRIVYRAAPGEAVIIEGVEHLVALRGISYVTIEGMTFRDPIRGWGEIQDGHYNELIGNKFYGNGRGSRTTFTGLYLFDGSSYNRIINNVFQDWGKAQTQWGDALGLSWNASYTLIEGNRFINAGHALLSIDTSYNIIRDNYFENAWQKGIDIVWRVSPPWAPGQEFVARRNVIESNTFVRCRIAADGQKGGAGIQMSSAQTIFRRNLLIENEGGGITLNGWEPDAPRGYGNRIYHNTIAANGIVANRETSGVFVTQWGYTGVNLSDTVLKNNILYRNAGETLQLLLDLYPSAQYGGAYFRSYLIAGNCISRAPTMDIQSLDGGQSLLHYQQRYPEFVAANLDAEPQFVNPAARDYRLTTESPCIDAGVPLTTTMWRGSGRTVPVADASYFMDGYGLVPGDQVKVGANPAVVVLSVDYANNTLTLIRSITWAQGDPVYVGEFSGSGPDIGAFEAGDAAPSYPIPGKPSIPASRIWENVVYK